MTFAMSVHAYISLTFFSHDNEFPSSSYPTFGAVDAQLSSFLLRDYYD